MNMEFVLAIAGVIITLLVSILGYFLKLVHSDLKLVMVEAGKNKGRIELVEQQLNNDVKRIEQTTQLELRNLAQTVGKLSDSVEQLVQIQMSR
jgi:hypothetical protein